MATLPPSPWLVVAEWPAGAPVFAWGAQWRQQALPLYPPGPALAVAQRGRVMQLAAWTHDETPIDWPRLCASLARVGVPEVTAFFHFHGTMQRCTVDTTTATTAAHETGPVSPVTARAPPLPGFRPDAVLCAPSLASPQLGPADACRMCVVANATVAARPCDCLVFCDACAADYKATPFVDMCPVCQQTVAWFESMEI